MFVRFREILRLCPCFYRELKDNVHTFREMVLNLNSTGRRFCYAHGDLGFSLKLFQIAAEAQTATLFGDLTLPVRFYYASATLLLLSHYDNEDLVTLSLR